MTIPKFGKLVLTFFINSVTSCQEELQKAAAMNAMLEEFSVNLKCEVASVDIAIPEGRTNFEDATEGDVVRTPMLVFSGNGKYFHSGIDPEFFRKWLIEHDLWVESCAAEA